VSEPAALPTVAELTLSALNDRGSTALDEYSTSLISACQKHPPPYGMSWYGDKYRDLGTDPQWFAHSLIANAEKEGEGSRKLWELSGRTGDPEISKKIKNHAIDESRHARLYIVMLGLIFPDALAEGVRTVANSISPGFNNRQTPPKAPFAAIDHVMDEVIQMNIGEIRTRIHQQLLRPLATAYCENLQPGNKPKLTTILESLMEDETRHIEYTAILIDWYAKSGHSKFVKKTMSTRIKDFNDITLAEVAEGEYVGE